MDAKKLLDEFSRCISYFESTACLLEPWPPRAIASWRDFVTAAQAELASAPPDAPAPPTPGRRPIAATSEVAHEAVALSLELQRAALTAIEMSRDKFVKLAGEAHDTVKRQLDELIEGWEDEEDD